MKRTSLFNLELLAQFQDRFCCELQSVVALQDQGSTVFEEDVLETVGHCDRRLSQERAHEDEFREQVNDHQNERVPCIVEHVRREVLEIHLCEVMNS
jgi:hypothetical protein